MAGTVWRRAVWGEHWLFQKIDLRRDANQQKEGNMGYPRSEIVRVEVEVVKEPERYNGHLESERYNGHFRCGDSFSF